MKSRRTLLAAGIAAVLLLAAAALLIPQRTYTLILDGHEQSLRTRALTVGSALRSAGLALSAEDQVDPSSGSLLFGRDIIRLDRSRPVQIFADGDEPVTLTSASRTPADWLEQAGLTLGPSDRLYSNGQRVQPGESLPLKAAYSLQIRRAVEITLHQGSESQTIQSAAETLGEALYEAGVTLTAVDRLSLPPTMPLTAPLEVTLAAARPVEIQLRDKTLTVMTSAETVGAALADADISLQGLDYSQPAESEPLPSSGPVKVVRVREEVQLQQTALAYGRQTQEDPNTELDQRSVIQAGQFGLQVSRVRTRFEDGQQVSQQAEAEWVAKEPQDELVGYGTKVVIKTMDTPNGPIEYWRAVTVYTTSYSPCRSGGDRCYPGTASGIPVSHGVISVNRAWYNWFVGQKLYVPGYGTGVIADVGGGVPGTYWIDLGYSDADYVPWHSNVTVYFLTPVPENIPWILP